MIVDFNNTPYEVRELGGLKRHDSGKIAHFSREVSVPKPTDLSDFVKKQNGLTVVEEEDSYRVYTDPFRTIPAFIVRDRAGGVFLYTEFEDVYDAPNVDMTIDRVGFWEILLFESGLWDRTLYENVKQLPGAACFTIGKTDGRFDVRRYWDFCIAEDDSIQNDEKAIDGFYERLTAIFDRLDSEQHYVLGLSGGLDSRLTLALLSERIGKSQVKLFTYGFDPCILEYKFAKSIAAAFDFAPPDFHGLAEDSYRRAISSLPRLSGGQVGIYHCHMYDYFDAHRDELRSYTNLSTYYTDALFGWDTWLPKKIDRIEDSAYVKTVRSVKDLDEDVREAIEFDVAMALGGYDSAANYSSIDEYKYVVERNQKFHFYLAYIQGKAIPGIPLFADSELLEYCISIPLKLRMQKRLIDGLLRKHFPQVALDSVRSVSSRHFRAGPRGAGEDTGLREWFAFKVLNRLNSLLRVMTSGRAQVRNTYLTEEHDRLLYRYFRKDLTDARRIFVDQGLLSGAQADAYCGLPLRTQGGPKLALIGLASLVGEAVALESTTI